VAHPRAAPACRSDRHAPANSASDRWHRSRPEERTAHLSRQTN
jgi:hypothetical protein